MTEADRLIVVDDLLPDPAVYRAAALALPFQDIEAGPIVFHGMAPIGASPLSGWLADTYSLVTTYAAFRLSPAGQEEPNYIHTDRDMGDWTAILYLHPDPPAGDGTTFWRHRETGAIASTATADDLPAEWLAWRDRDRWAPWRTVAAAFNRLLLFPAPYFHSRALYDNYGTAAEGRLIQLAFGTGTFPCV